MRLWDKKHLSIKIFPLFPNISEKICELKIPKNVYDLVSEKLSVLKLVPVNKKFQNKLKTKECIQFVIDMFPASIEISSTGEEIYVNKPDFKKITDTVEIEVILPFMEYDKNKYSQIFLDNLEIAIVEGLTSLGIYSENISQTFNEIKNEVKANNKYWYFT